MSELAGRFMGGPGGRRENRLLVIALGTSVCVHAALIAWLPEFRNAVDATVARTLQVVLQKEPEPLPVQEPPQPRPRESRPPVDRHAKKPEKIKQAAAPARLTPQPQPQPEPQPQSQPQPVLTAPSATALPAETAPAAAQPSADSTRSAGESKPGVAAGPPGVAPGSGRESSVPASFNAAYLRNAPPNYPLIARRNGVEGTVRLRVLVTRDGRAAEVQLEQSSGSPPLDTAAREAVKAWRFVPARRGQESVESWVVVPIIFKLEGRS